MIVDSLRLLQRAKAESFAQRRQAVPCQRTALRKYKILDTPPELEFDNIAMLAARIFGTKFAAVCFIDGNRQWFKAEYGLGIRETPIKLSLCAFAIQSNALFMVEDARHDIRFEENPLVTGAPHIRFYAGMRISADDGTPLAVLCVMDPRPRTSEITEAQRRTLQILASQVQSLLELRRLLIEKRVEVSSQVRPARLQSC